MITLSKVMLHFAINISFFILTVSWVDNRLMFNFQVHLVAGRHSYGEDNIARESLYQYYIIIIHYIFYRWYAGSHGSEIT